MPEVDYRTWYKYQQQRAAEGKPTDIQPEYEPVGFQAPRYGEIDKETGQYVKDTGTAAAKGFVSGGPTGAAIAAAVAAAPQMARSGRRAWDAAKAGDTEGVSRSLAPIGPYFYMIGKMKGKSIAERMGAPSWTNPLNLFTKGISELFGGPRTNIEEKRWERLKEAGFDVPKWVDQGKQAKFDVKREDLGKDFVGYDPQGNWVNNKFAHSRDEKDLTAQDLQQYAVMPETFGSLWKGASQEARDQVANMALTDAKLRERLGTLEMEWTPENLKMAQDVLAQSIEQDPNVQQRRFWVPPTEKYVPPEERGPLSGYELMGPQVPYEQMNPYTRGRR